MQKDRYFTSGLFIFGSDLLIYNVKLSKFNILLVHGQ